MSEHTEARSIELTGDQLAARLPDLGGHRIDTRWGAYGLVFSSGHTTLDPTGPNECAGCGARLRLDPSSVMTGELLDDPSAQIPVEVSLFDQTSRTFVPLPTCPVPGPEHHSVTIEVPSGKLLVRNSLTDDEASPLHYELEHADGKSINSVAGQRHRTRVCAEELGYGIVATTSDVDVWRLGPDALQLGGPGHHDGGYGTYADGGESWIDLPEPGEFLGRIDVSAWSIEMIDLDRFTAAGGSLDDLPPHLDQLVVDLTPGTYRLTVMNEALEDWQCDRLGAVEPSLENRITARLVRI